MTAVPPLPDDAREKPPAESTVVGALADGFRPTDTGNAERYVAHAGGCVRYVGTWGKFVVYLDGRWVVDGGDALATEMAKGVARRMLRLAAEVDDKDQRHDLIAHARRCESAPAIGSMLRLARGMPGIYTDHEDFDRDPWLLNVANGTVDLRTGQLRPHDPDDLLTMQAPVMFDARARAPLWRHCLRRWQPDPKIRYFVQRVCGTAITGHPLELLAVNVGSGGNGKSKFYGALAAVIGPYCVVPHKSLLVAQRHEQHPTHVASLFRARLLVAPETTKGDKLDEELVKALTGGDQLRARRMREDEWGFDPTHTAVLHTNHRPLVKGTDEGIWRRLRLIPWDVTIPEDQRDPHLAAKLAQEQSGILNWLVDGALSWRAHGLCEPPAVRAATADYRQAEDHVGSFLADCCATGEHHSIPARRLREVYEAWCSDEGEQPWTAKSLGSELSSRGFDSVKVGGGKVWIGLDAGLRSTAAAA